MEPFGSRNGAASPGALWQLAQTLSPASGVWATWADPQAASATAAAAAPQDAA
jgi:hypothetical protein